MKTDHTIRGSCSCFVCRCCRTKFGWEHQIWCDYPDLIEPSCMDCVYYNAKNDRCKHPAKNRNGGMRDETNQYTV